MVKILWTFRNFQCQLGYYCVINHFKFLKAIFTCRVIVIGGTAGKSLSSITQSKSIVPWGRICGLKKENLNFLLFVIFCPTKIASTYLELVPFFKGIFLTWEVSKETLKRECNWATSPCIWSGSTSWTAPTE